MAKRQKVKHSMGIACCRLYKDEYQVLMVCKRFTYAFNNFIHGQYNISDKNGLIDLLSEMTIDEKIDILSFNFEQMWYRVWLNHISKNFLTWKLKFETNFMSKDNYKNNMLRKLISVSRNGKRIWEIPKGLKEKNEAVIKCAIREFYEETGINKEQFRLLPFSRTYSYVDKNTKYINTYHLAFTDELFVPKINTRIEMGEVSEIRFVSSRELEVLDLKPEYIRFIRNIFKIIKKEK